MTKKGRPSKFKPEFVSQAKKLAKQGWTLAEMADFWDVDERSVQRWMADRPSFCRAIKQGRVLPDDRVEESLYRRAVGYEHDSEEIKVVDKGVVRVPIIKRYPPDPVACIFWLRNRRPNRWSNAPDPSGEGENAVPTRVVLEVVDARKREDGPG